MSAPHTIIRASAGAGKTYQLSTRFLQLLFSGAEAANILASTFTRKAAGEILERIFERLAKGCRDEDSARELGEALELEELSLEQTRACLTRLVGAMDRIQVSTIDAFFARLASAFALDVGLPPRWRMMDESAVKTLRLEAIQRMAETDRGGLLELWRLLNEGADPRKLSSQLDSLAEKAHRLYVEGDREAWCFLEKEIEGEIPRRAEVDALVHRLDELPDAPNKHWLNLFEKDRALLLAEKFEALLESGICAKLLDGGDMYQRKPIEGVFREFYEELVRVATRGVLCRFAARNRGSFDLLERFDAHFQRLKLERGSLYFDDLQRLLSNLTQLGELEEIFFRLETRIQHILLDEFQDTSREQWRVLAPLVEELASQDGAEQSVFVVGDAKQAIYGWRGGEAEIFRSLDRQLHLSEEHLQQLSKSWRSAQAILDGVNVVFEGLAENPVLAEYPDSVARWQKDFQTHESAHPLREGQVFYHAADEAAFNSSESRSEAVRARAVELIAELSERHPGVDIGVLLKRNEALASLRAALAARGIEASEEGGVSLARQPSVALLLSLLRAAEHPGDRIALFHLASSPLREELELQLPPREGDGARLSAKIRRQIHRDGLRACLLEYALRLHPFCGASSRSRLRKLISAAQRFERDGSQSVAEFLRWIESGRAEDPTAAAIRLMTVHGAKGLQFSIVVLCDLEASFAKRRRDEFLVGREDPRRAPNQITRTPKKLLRSLSPTLAEIARVEGETKMSETLSALYVGMTRASHALHMVGAAPQKGRPADSPGALLRAAYFPEAEPAAGESVLLLGSEEIDIESRPHQGQPPREMRLPKLAKSAGARVAAKDAPSSHETGQVRDAPSLLQLSDPAARLRGIALHRCFEAVEFSEDPLETDASILAGLRRELPELEAGELPPFLTEFHELRLRTEIHDALSRKRYGAAWGNELRLELWRERAFALRQGDAIVRGRYDRVVLGCGEDGYRRAHVLDFKSDRFDPADASEVERLRERYTPQMQAYRRAVAKRCRLPEELIECSLLFLSASLHMQL